MMVHAKATTGPLQGSPVMAQATPPKTRRKPDLIGWDAIAAFLGVNVSTAKRWEKDEGMPVIRWGGGRLVRAYSDELTEWAEQRDGPRPSATRLPSAPTG